MNILEYLQSQIKPVAKEPDYGNPRVQEVWEGKRWAVFFDMPNRTTDSLAISLQQGGYFVKNRGRSIPIKQEETENRLAALISQIPLLRSDKNYAIQ